MDTLIREAIKNKFKVQDFIPYFQGNFDLLSKLKDTIQDPEWHSEGDVEIHTDMVLIEIYKIIEEFNINQNDAKMLVLAALLHDICKPITTKEREKEGKVRIVAPKHEIFGRSAIIFDLLGLDLTNQEIFTIANLVGYHNLPKLAVVKNDTLQNYKQIARVANPRLLYFLELADMRGRTCSDWQDGIDNIEFFKILSQEYNVFESNPYQREIDYANTLDLSTQQKLFTLGSFQRDFENNILFMIEESVSKMYGYISDYSHLVIMCGVAGSGKSTHAQQYIDKGYHLLSLDNLREDKNTNNNQIRSITKNQLKKHLANKDNVVIDATNYRRDFRNIYTTLGFNYNAFVQIDTILNSKPTVFKNNNNRSRQVDTDVILNQMKKFELPELTEAHCVRYILNDEIL